MALFSKSNKSQPETASSEASLDQSTLLKTEPVPAPWAMTEEHYKALTQKLDLVLENVGIVNDNVRLAISRINTLQEDLEVDINNGRIIGRDQDKLIKDVQDIERVVNRIERALGNLNK